MTRLVPALRLELTLQVRQKFLHAAVFSGLIWLAVLLPMPVSLRPVAEPYVLVGDIAIIGFFFVGGTVFFEKQERTIGAIVSTPLRFWEYLAAKLTVLLAISLFVAVVVATIVHGLGYHLLPLVAGIVLGTLLMLLVGFSSSLPFASVTDWFRRRSSRSRSCWRRRWCTTPACGPTRCFTSSPPRGRCSCSARRSIR